MTDISSINNQSAAISTNVSCKKSDLTEETKKKLEALGIVATDDMTEAEARQLIQQAEQANAPAQTENNNATSEEVLADIKSLATRVGVNYSDEDDADTILDKICDKIDVALDSIEPDELQTIQGYFDELTSLNTQYSDISSTQNNIYQAMEQSAVNNKYALGIK